MSEKSSKKLSIAVLGGGSWATALVKIFLENSPRIHWYMRSQEAIDYLKEHGHNPKYLTDIQFDTGRITLTSDINSAVKAADILILAIPSAFLQKELEALHMPLTRHWFSPLLKVSFPIVALLSGSTCTVILT